MIFRQIKNLRIDKDLSQAEIANYLHVQQNTYSRYETGASPIPVDLLIELALFHEKSLDYIVELDAIKRSRR